MATLKQARPNGLAKIGFRIICNAHARGKLWPSFRLSSYLFAFLRELAFIMVQCCFHGSFLMMLSRDSTPIPAIPRSQPNRRQLTRSDSFPTPIQNTKTVSGLGALSGCQLVSVPCLRMPVIVIFALKSACQCPTSVVLSG